jgi:protein-S-isoprenylcysteine O-methyltransferase Ste14
MQSELIYRLLLLALFVGFVAFRGYFQRKFGRPDEDTVKQRRGSTAEKIANLLSIPALVATFLFIVYPAWMSWASLPLPDWLRWVGVVIAGLGFALLQWAHQALGRNWSDQPRLMKDQSLVTSGPYHWIRHPIYAAFLLVMSAPLLISANWFIGFLWLGLTALEVMGRMRFEEGLMIETFGEQYQLYMQTTGRLIPRLVR